MLKEKNTLNLGELDVIYRYESSIEDRPKILSSADCLEVLKELYNIDKIGMQEQFIVIYMNRNNRVIGCSNMFLGGISGVVADVRIIVSAALKLLASGVVISHNHPSGNLEPSKEDRQTTVKLRDALELFDIKLLDHVLVSPDFRYFSFTNEGML